MTPPPEQPADQTAVILARMEVKLDNALQEQTRHTTQLDRHELILGQHGNRLTALETRDVTQDQSKTTTFNSKYLFWTALGSLAAFVAGLMTIIATHH